MHVVSISNQTSVYSNDKNAYQAIYIYVSLSNGAGPQQSFGGCLGSCLEE